MTVFYSTIIEETFHFAFSALDISESTKKGERAIREMRAGVCEYIYMHACNEVRQLTTP